MSQDKPVLIAKKIEKIRAGLKELALMYFDDPSVAHQETDALCDLALSALDRKGKWVPLEPTSAMLEAIENHYRKWQKIIPGISDDDVKADSWGALQACRAMLAAAPHNDHEPPQEKPTRSPYDMNGLKEHPSE